MTVKLCSVFNPDYPRHQQNIIAPVVIPVDDIKGASIACKAFIESADIGSGNWSGGAGEVRDENGQVIARISYNGRAWETTTTSIYDRKEISI
jgi:hypothetical protein